MNYPCRTHIEVKKSDIAEYAEKNRNEFSEIALDAFVDSEAVKMVEDSLTVNNLEKRQAIAVKMLDAIEKYIADFYEDDPDMIEFIEDRIRAERDEDAA